MEILKIFPKNYKEIIVKAVKAVKEGKIIICLTDTVYGLISDATNEKAVRRLFKIKKRPAEKAIPIFVKNIEMAKSLAKIDKREERFLQKIWPGKVTVVLRRKNKLPKILFGNEKTIGLRIPKYKIINQLLEKVNLPLTGTSANISGKPASTRIKEILDQFKNQKWQPDLVLDAGNLIPAKPSTVIDLSGTKPKILRIGEVSKKMLMKFL